MYMHSGELCGNSAVIARNSCSMKSTDQRHHHQVQQQQHQPSSQLHQTTSHQSNAVVAAARSLQQSCYDEQRRLHTHHHRHQHQQSRDADRAVAPSSADCIGIQPHPSASQQRIIGGGDAVLRHSHKLDHYGETAKPIKSEPNDAAMAGVASAVSEARKLTESKSSGLGRTAIGSASTTVTATPSVDTVDSLLHGVSSTSLSSSTLNDVLSRHHHTHQQQQQAAEMQQTGGSGSFTVSSLVHPTTGSGGGGFVSERVRDVSVDTTLNGVDSSSVVNNDSSCFDPSTAAAAAAAAQWFANHQAGPQSVGYSSRCTPGEFYMQRLHDSIDADRRHSVIGGLGDADADGTVPLSTPSFGHHGATGGYAAWYGVVQSADGICSPAAGSSAYIGSAGLHDMFDVSAATRMLSTRQSCAQLQTDSPFRAYYGTGVVGQGPAAYAAYAEDCAASAKY